MMQNALWEEVEQVLQTNVRPSLINHKGDISIKDITDDGVLKVEFHGNCNGCPSALLTLESLVAKEVINAVPGISAVEMVSGVSDELLETAQRILRKRRGEE